MPRKISNAQETMLRDLAAHAGEKAHAAMRDACQLVEEQDMAYSIAINVISSLLCSAARMIPGKKSHGAKIAISLQNLAELMVHHAKH